MIQLISLWLWLSDTDLFGPIRRNEATKCANKGPQFFFVQREIHLVGNNMLCRIYISMTVVIFQAKINVDFCLSISIQMQHTNEYTNMTYCIYKVLLDDSAKCSVTLFFPSGFISIHFLKMYIFLSFQHICKNCKLQTAAE